MEIGETMYVTTREEFRAWLEANHKLRKEIWSERTRAFAFVHAGRGGGAGAAGAGVSQG